MLHGFTSAPHVFRPLAEYISKKYGYEIHVPLIPGHGLTFEKLDDFRSEDWIKFSEDQFVQLTVRYKKIHVMGLSMGGTLAAHLASKFPDLVQSLTLFSPALFVKKFWSRLALPFFRWLPNSFLRKQFLQKPQDRLTDKLSYQTYNYANAIEFDNVCRFVKHEFDSDAPMRIFVPTKDEVIDPESSTWFYHHGTNANRELIELPHSPHIVFMGNDNEKIFKAVDQFFNSIA